MRNNRFIVFYLLWALVALPAGLAEAADRALGFAVSGVVLKVMVNPGQKVSAGQKLAVLDTTRIRARLVAVEAEITAAKGAAELSERRFIYAEEQFDAVSLSKVELDSARIDRDEALARLAKATARKTVLQWRATRSTLTAAEGGRVKLVATWPGQVINLGAGTPTAIVVSVP